MEGLNYKDAYYSLFNSITDILNMLERAPAEYKYIEKVKLMLEYAQALSEDVAIEE